MDRVNGANTVDIGGGRRGFKSQNAAAGIPGTEVTDKILNDVQEEICAVIENSGFVLDSENQQQLWEALQSIAAPGFANRAAWFPVISISTIAPPNDAVLGDAYVIPAGANGAWAGNQQKLAEWTGSSWRIVTTKDGHGVSLPDGRVFVKVEGVYVEKLALDSQSGKWAYVAAAGSSNAITASLAPAPTALVAGMAVRLKMSSANTGPTTFNLNGLGAKNIVYDELGGNLNGADWMAGSIVTFIYDGSAWRLRASIGLFDKRYARLTTPPQNDFYVVGPTGSDANTGFAATPAEGFATIQGAINAISSRYITNGTVTINVSHGSYGGFVIIPSYVQCWEFVGDRVAPANCIINAATEGQTNGRGCTCTGAVVGIVGFSFDTLYENVVSSIGAQVGISDCIIKLPAGAAASLSASGGRLSLTGVLKIVGSGPYFVSVSMGGTLIAGYSDGISVGQLTLDGSAGPNFTACGVFVEMGSAARFLSSQVVVVPGATGQRYQARYNGVIDVQGAGVNFLPGNTAGVASTGGQYN